MEDRHYIPAGSKGLMTGDGPHTRPANVSLRTKSVDTPDERELAANEVNVTVPEMRSNSPQRPRVYETISKQNLKCLINVAPITGEASKMERRQAS